MFTHQHLFCGLGLFFSGDFKIGERIRHHDCYLISTISGTLKDRDGFSLSVEGPTHRYCPASGDSVLGCITDVHADGFSVSTGSSSLAALPCVSLSVGTKQSRPKLNIGALVHARVQRVNHLGEVALTCVEEMHDVRGLGVLTEGFFPRCNSKFARNMQSRSFETVLGILGSAVSFEIATGHNGRVWIATSTRQQAILIVKALSGCFYPSASCTVAHDSSL